MGSEIAHWRQTVVSAPGEEQITPEGVSEGDDVQLGDRSGQKLVKQRPGGGGDRATMRVPASLPGSGISGFTPSSGLGFLLI